MVQHVIFEAAIHLGELLGLASPDILLSSALRAPASLVLLYEGVLENLKKQIQLEMLNSLCSKRLPSQHIS